MQINRTGKRKCPECKGVGKTPAGLCQHCGGYGAVTLRRLEQMRRATNEGRTVSKSEGR